MNIKSIMSPEDVVRQFLEAQNKHDLDGAMALLADDFVRLGEGAKWIPISKEKYRDMWARFARAFPDLKWEMTCMVTSGDTVAIDVLETGTFQEPWACQGRTVPPTGKHYRGRISVFFRVDDDGRIHDSEEEGTSIATQARRIEPESDRGSFFGPSSASGGRHAWEWGAQSFFSREL